MLATFTSNEINLVATALRGGTCHPNDQCAAADKLNLLASRVRQMEKMLDNIVQDASELGRRPSVVVQFPGQQRQVAAVPGEVWR